MREISLAKISNVVLFVPLQPNELLSSGQCTETHDGEKTDGEQKRVVDGMIVAVTSRSAVSSSQVLLHVCSMLSSTAFICSCVRMPAMRKNGPRTHHKY